MKKIFFITSVIMTLFCSIIKAQNYNNIVNYFVNGTPNNGIKIKTNIPFGSAVMPTIMIQGYHYASGSAMGLILNFYNYSNPAPSFIKAAISSFGNYTPPVILANEGGKIVIFINDKPYFQRFTVNVFSTSIAGDATPANFQGWTTADEALTGTDQLLVPYRNTFAGIVTMPGSGIWDSAGNVGIGTTSLSGAYKLSVNGNIRAKEIKVETGWADYVFDKGYRLKSLPEVEKFIEKNHHLPDVVSAAEVQKEGVSLGQSTEMLLRKIEELTLYLIEKDKELKAVREANTALGKRVSKLERSQIK